MLLRAVFLFLISIHNETLQEVSVARDGKTIANGRYLTVKSYTNV